MGAPGLEKHNMKKLLVFFGVAVLACFALAELDSIEFYIGVIDADTTNSVTNVVYKPCYLEGVFINKNGSDSTCAVQIAALTNDVAAERTLFHKTDVSASGQYMVRVEPTTSDGSSSAVNTESNAAVVRALIPPGKISMTITNAGVSGAVIKATVFLSDR